MHELLKFKPDIKLFIKQQTINHNYYYKSKIKLYFDAMRSLEQNGGSIIKQIKYMDEIFDFVLLEEDNDTHIYILYAKTSDDECVIINIDNVLHEANISNISTDGRKCSNKILTNVGTHLIHITIKFIKKYFTSVKQISLTDHSFIYCKKAKTKNGLNGLMILKTGHTFYGKLGFIPYDENVSEMKKLVKLYNNNLQIMDGLTVNSSNIINILHKFIKTHNSIKQDTINKIVSYAEKHTDQKFTKFFAKIFTKESYDELCSLLMYIEKKMFTIHKLTYFLNSTCRIYIKIINTIKNEN